MSRRTSRSSLRVRQLAPTLAARIITARIITARILTACILTAGSLTACAPGTGDDDAGSTGMGGQGARVDVDTPELRELRASTDLAACRPGTGQPVDGGFPSLTLPCLGGGTDVDLASLRGPMVISLWASWCEPCRRELPIFEKFHDQHGDQVKVLGIDYNDTQPAEALKLARRSGISYPVLADPSSEIALAGPLPNIPGLPALIFIDAEGSIQDADGNPRVVFREIDSLDALERLVEKQLEVRL